MVRRRYKRHLIQIISIKSIVTVTATNSTVDETSSIFILPGVNTHDEGRSNRNSNGTSHDNDALDTVNVFGSLDNAQNPVFQVTKHMPPVTMQKSLSFQDYMLNNEKYEYASFQIDDTGDSLNIMSITGANGIPRFVGSASVGGEIIYSLVHNVNGEMKVQQTAMSDMLADDEESEKVIQRSTDEESEEDSENSKETSNHKGERQVEITVKYNASSLEMKEQIRGTEISIMVLWTPEAICNMSKGNDSCDITDSKSIELMEDLITLAVEETNASYIMSKVNANLRLVYTGIID
jgi:hypothetical protein